MSPTSLTFADQNVGTKSPPQTDTLTNIGSTALSIEKIGITGADPKDFLETNNCPASLPAEKSCAIKVTFKPTAVGTRFASLSVSYKGIGSPQIVPLSGTGISLSVTLTPAKLTFATQLIGTVSSPQLATLTNTGDQAVSISNILTTGAFKQTNDCPSSLQPNASCKIQVEFAPKAKGLANGKLSVEDDAVGSPQTITLAGTGTVVELSPEGLNFGDQKVGTKSTPVPVTLTNKGKTSLSISKIAITGNDPGDFTQKNNCGTSVPAGGQCKISVTFAPTAQGARSAMLSVSDDGGGSPQTVSLSGTGT
jgi:archaellum component FlaF (FlaF/FlaG flagellin family)